MLAVKHSRMHRGKLYLTGHNTSSALRKRDMLIVCRVLRACVGGVHINRTEALHILACNILHQQPLQLV